MRPTTPATRPLAMVAAALVAGLMALATVACEASPSPSAAGPRCLDLHAEVVRLAWSQRGLYLAVGTKGADGTNAGYVIAAAAADPGNTVIEAEMLPTTVVATADGRLAWISDRPGGRLLTVDDPGGMIFAPLPDDIEGLAWTAIGYALLERTEAGSRILMLDPDRPAAPAPLYRTELTIEHLWISADPEAMLLTVVHPDHRDAPVSFDLVGATTSNRLEPPGADSSGGSMPSLRRQVVYRSAISGRMEAVPVDDPTAPTILSSRPALRGAVSDAGMLAYADATAPGSMCLEDVSALLREGASPTT